LGFVKCSEFLTDKSQAGRATKMQLYYFRSLLK
jgi:hypothetical protein